MFEVQVAGRPETARRVEVPWGDAERRRLSVWLFVASVVTVALVLVLFALARLRPSPASPFKIGAGRADTSVGGPRRAGRKRAKQ